MEELKKIITDGKKKYRVFEDADEAMKALDSLKQAEADYKKRVEGLKREEAGISKKLAVAEAEAEGIISLAKQELDKAKLDGQKIREKAENDAKSYEKQIAFSEETLKDCAEKISDRKKTIRELDKSIAEKEGKLAQIEAERKKALERLAG